MRSKKNNKQISIIILTIAVLVLAIIFIPTKKPADTDEVIAKCIGEKATLYVQLGCSHCKTQENILGENLNHIKVIDCFYDSAKCDKITATPTWKIGNEYIVGVKSFNELKELTNC